jgi:alpha-L-fucosidase
MRTALMIAAAMMILLSQWPVMARGETARQRDARMAWWREARFGMFIHFGLYSIPAGRWEGKEINGVGEWIQQKVPVSPEQYAKLADQFNPKQFDAEAWVKIAKDAGMKYIVITSKHHDGFALFDSKVSDYDVTITPFNRDILKELADAARGQGLKICWYHSIMDWHHPDAQAPKFPHYNDGKSKNPNFPRYVERYLKPQVKELLTNYGPIGVMWFDGEWIPEWTETDGKDLYAFCRSIQPDVIVNNRVGKGRSGMQGMSKDANAAGDFGTPEQEVPPAGIPGVDWESCMTMNDTWGYKIDDHNFKSSQELIRTLIDIASKGGNFLLNVGPTPDGVIPPESVERLGDIGRWMKANGESIYGTSASPVADKLPWGRITSKPSERKLYLHVFDWPSDGKLEVPIAVPIERAILLPRPGQSLGVKQTPRGVQILLPKEAPDPAASVIVLELSEATPATSEPAVSPAAPEGQ